MYTSFEISSLRVTLWRPGSKKISSWGDQREDKKRSSKRHGFSTLQPSATGKKVVDGDAKNVLCGMVVQEAHEAIKMSSHMVKGMITDNTLKNSKLTERNGIMIAQSCFELFINECVAYAARTTDSVTKSSFSQSTIFSLIALVKLKEEITRAKAS